MLIRWLATEVRIFAYFKNLPLTAAFLGLSLGFIWADKKRDFFFLSTACFLLLSIIVSSALQLKLTFLSFVDPLKFLLFGLENSDQHSLMSSLKTAAIMLGLFVLAAASFVGMGQRMGRLFEKLKPLQAYSVNVLGGLIGTILFSALCFFYTSPGVWLIVAGLLFLLVRPKPFSACIVGFGIFYLAWLGPFVAQHAYGENNYQKTVWSPYYRIDVATYRLPEGPMKGVPIGYEVYANYDGFQSILDVTQKAMAGYLPAFREACLDYHAGPFKLAPTGPGSKALVLGAGSGADVAAALRAGIASIDAVEIDPAIASLGRDVHPEHPYLSPRVKVYVTDARTFLKNSRDKYDVIVFAYLDSHAAFSCLSSLRMDNYVFTRESLSDAAKLLKPNGYIAIGCVLMTDWLWDRHARNLASATNMQPLGWRDEKPKFNNNGVLFAGPGLVNLKYEGLFAGQLKPVTLNDAVPVSTDDWPFLFLPKREIPTLYLWPIFSILLVSFLPVATQFARGAKESFNWQMFFMGAGFMLLEVRSMADMSLMFGSTWLTNSVIISGVMLIILLANYSALRLRITAVPWLAIGLLAGLILTLVAPASQLTFLGPLMGSIAGTVCCLVPMAFAAVLFALFFRDVKNPCQALAFNLVGGVLGVLLEYTSMLMGIRALSYVAICLYALAIGLQFRRVGWKGGAPS
jgi:hypothetical protein